VELLDLSWHLGTLKVLEYKFGTGVGVLVLAIVLSLALAAASYHFIEMPMLSLRRRFGSHVAPAPKAGVAEVEMPTRRAIGS
jgi:peptidoglycan/LPS O-acetylase OafA/YrhL